MPPGFIDPAPLYEIPRTPDSSAQPARSRTATPPRPLRACCDNVATRNGPFGALSCVIGLGSRNRVVCRIANVHAGKTHIDALTRTRRNRPSWLRPPPPVPRFIGGFPRPSLRSPVARAGLCGVATSPCRRPDQSQQPSAPRPVPEGPAQARASRLQYAPRASQSLAAPPPASEAVHRDGTSSAPHRRWFEAGSAPKQAARADQGWY